MPAGDELDLFTEVGPGSIGELVLEPIRLPAGFGPPYVAPPGEATVRCRHPINGRTLQLPANSACPQGWTRSVVFSGGVQQPLKRFCWPCLLFWIALLALIFLSRKHER